MSRAWKWLLVGLAVVVGLQLALVPYLLNRVDQNAEDAVADDRTAQFEACQRSNKQLRFVINQHIIRPFHDVVQIAATPSGDPAFDVFVPFYQRALDQIEPVPYAICRNAYPPDGSEPHPPYFRDAPLPKPLSPDGERQGRQRGSESPANGTASTGGDAAQTGTSPGQPPSPPQSGPPGTTGPGGPEGPSGPPGENPPPQQPDDPGLLDPITDPICDLTGGLGLPICL